MKQSAQRITLLLIIFAATVLPSFGQRLKVSYYSRTATSTVTFEAYVADAVDERPEFPGGDNAMMSYINKVRRYPRQAYNLGIEGRVLCAFIVMPNGAISNIEVLRGVEESIDREAVRIIKNMPSWRAGRISGNAVPVYCIVPIPFRR